MSTSKAPVTYRITPDPSILPFFKGEIFLIGEEPRPATMRLMAIIDGWAQLHAINGEDVSRHFAFILRTPNRICLGLEDPGEVNKVMEKHGESAERALARLASENSAKL